MTLTEEQIEEIKARAEAARQPFAMTNGDYLLALKDREALLSHIGEQDAALEAANKRADEAEGGRTVRQERIEKLEARLLEVLATIRLREEKVMELTRTSAAHMRRADEAEAERDALRARVAELEVALKTIACHPIENFCKGRPDLGIPGYASCQDVARAALTSKGVKE